MVFGESRCYRSVSMWAAMGVGTTSALQKWPQSNGMAGLTYISAVVSWITQDAADLRRVSDPHI